VRIGGGLKGSERLDKSNPLKVLYALPTNATSNLAISRARFTRERSVSKSRKEKAMRQNERKDIMNETHDKLTLLR